MKLWRYDENIKGCKYLVIRRDASIPEWPHFVIGAADPCALAALRAYAKEAARRNLDHAYVESLKQLQTDFREWALYHKPGGPDAPPHRQDHPAVIAAMEGRLGVLWLNYDKYPVELPKFADEDERGD